MPLFAEVDRLLGEVGLLRHSVANPDVAAAAMQTDRLAGVTAGAEVGTKPVATGPKLWLVAAGDAWYLERDEAKAQAAAQKGHHVEPVVPGLAQAETAAATVDADANALLESVARKRDIATAKDVDGVGDQGLRTIFMADGKPVVALWPGAHMDSDPDGVRTNRVLVLVHGTFSSTQSLVDNFLGGGETLLQEFADSYRAIVGFTHWTRSVTPDVNARLFAENLQQLLANLQANPAWGGEMPEFDLIAHSRGGLVVRSLLELLSPNDYPVLNRMRDVVFVATPNAGTNLALPQNWGRLAGAFARLLVAVPGAGLVFKELMIRLGSDAENDWPGVDCMEPGGEWLTANMYQCHKPAGVQYYTVSGDYKPAEWKPLKALEDWFWDVLFRVANDTVVDTQSVTGQTLVQGQRENQQVGYLLPLAASLLITDGADDAVPHLADTLRQANIEVQMVQMAGVDHSGYFRTAPFREYLHKVLLHG